MTATPNPTILVPYILFFVAFTFSNSAEGKHACAKYPMVAVKDVRITYILS
jgi:hypothetical protein